MAHFYIVMVMTFYMHYKCSLVSQAKMVSDDGTKSESEFQDILTRTCFTLNVKCHKCIKAWTSKNASTPHNIVAIDIEKCKFELAPDIWKAISVLTQPLSQKAITRAITNNIGTQ